MYEVWIRVQIAGTRQWAKLETHVYTDKNMAEKKAEQLRNNGLITEVKER